MEIYTNMRVGRILVEEDHVFGVETSAGDVLRAKQVISNLDVTATRRDLLHQGTFGDRVEVSGSGFIMILGIKRQHPELAHHNFFFSGDYAHEFT